MPKPKNMREAAIRNHYLTRLSELLRQIYIRRPSSSTKTSDVHQRLSGFIEAALISRTVSNTDIQAAVDQEPVSDIHPTPFLKHNDTRRSRTSKRLYRGRTDQQDRIECGYSGNSRSGAYESLRPICRRTRSDSATDSCGLRQSRLVIL